MNVQNLNANQSCVNVVTSVLLHVHVVTANCEQVVVKNLKHINKTYSKYTVVNYIVY